MSTNRHGFTLVEVLLASMLSTLVITGAFFSLSVMLKAFSARQGSGQATETAALIFERIRQDLESVYLSPNSDMTRFVGMDEQSEQFDADNLTFVSMVNDPTALGQGTSDLAEVQYYIDLDDSTPERGLLRRFDATPDQDPFTGGTVALLGPRVVMLNITYFDGQLWMPEWDSESAIPQAINVQIGLFHPTRQQTEPTPETLQTFSTTIWTAVYRDSGGAMGGEGGEEA